MYVDTRPYMSLYLIYYLMYFISYGDGNICKVCYKYLSAWIKVFLFTRQNSVSGVRIYIFVWDIFAPRPLLSWQSHKTFIHVSHYSVAVQVCCKIYCILYKLVSYTFCKYTVHCFTCIFKTMRQFSYAFMINQ